MAPGTGPSSSGARQRSVGGARRLYCGSFPLGRLSGGGWWSSSRAVFPIAWIRQERTVTLIFRPSSIKYVRQYSIRNDSTVDEYGRGARRPNCSDRFGPCKLHVSTCQGNYVLSALCCFSQWTQNVHCHIIVQSIGWNQTYLMLMIGSRTLHCSKLTVSTAMYPSLTRWGQFYWGCTVS